jgi:glycine betaine/choline ABC-type transport system substrate-binding protein
LDEGKFDASFVNNTDGQLFADPRKYTLLGDDKGVLPAGNVVFVVDEQTLEEAGDGLEETVFAVQKGFTLPAIRRMNAEVELEGKDPAKVAETYLSQVQLPG